MPHTGLVLEVVSSWEKPQSNLLALQEVGFQGISSV